MWGNYCGYNRYGYDLDSQGTPVGPKKDPVDDLDAACSSHDEAYSPNPSSKFFGASKFLSLAWDDAFARIDGDIGLIVQGLKAFFDFGKSSLSGLGVAYVGYAFLRLYSVPQLIRSAAFEILRAAWDNRAIRGFQLISGFGSFGILGFLISLEIDGQ